MSEGEGEGESILGEQEREALLEKQKLLKTADPALAAYIAMKKLEDTLEKAKLSKGSTGEGGGGKKRGGGGGAVATGMEVEGVKGAEESVQGLQGRGKGGAVTVASASGEYLRDSRFSLL
jgi:hypothetical protein